MSATHSDIDQAIAAIIKAVDQCIALGEFKTAEALVGQGVSLSPDDSQLILRRARLNVIAKQFAEALADYRAVTGCIQNDARVWTETARAAARVLDWSTVIDAFRCALELDPANAPVWAELGHAQVNARQLDAAAASFARSLALEPGQAEVWNDLGTCQMAGEKFADARQSFRKSISNSGARLEWFRNFAIANEWSGDAEGAIDALTQAVDAHSNSAAANQKLGALLLSCGRLAEGWQAYRNRFDNPEHKGWHRGISLPRLKGESLAGQRVLIWSDQGLGDQILVAGLLREAIGAAEHVVFACEPRLQPIVARSFPGLRVVPLTELHTGKIDLGDVGVQASISELGPVLRRDLGSFAPHSGYLCADSARSAELRNRYARLPGTGPVVGLSWRSVNDIAGADKTVALSTWGPILKSPNVRFVSLQYGDASADAAAANQMLGSAIHVDPDVDAVRDVDGFAAQVAAMDVVISVSNTTVHMAGAMNIPTLCLTPRVEGRPWYWFKGQDTSLWYPSVRHVWQTRRGRWDDAIDAAAAELVAIATR